MNNIYSFPKDFEWGTATSAHQIEGNNTNSDWWKWEQSKKPSHKYPEQPSGIACDSYNRYEEDFDLCVDLNNTAVRISVEWARIQPAPDYFDKKEIEHYKKVLKAAKDRHLKTFVTLHHFTNPIWLSKKGGWTKPEVVEHFASYSKKCAEEFGDLVDVYLTINEPQVYALMSFVNGAWPPNKKNPFTSLLVQINMIKAHRRAYKTIKAVNGKDVGIVKNVVWYETDPYNTKPWDTLACKLLNYIGRDFFLRPLLKHMDLLGLNYYFTHRITNLRSASPDDYVSDLGWWINPPGLENILEYLASYGIPIYITENGLADATDKYRKHFIRDMLIACAKAIDKGVPLKGYFHWSLLDNFEWIHGYWPRFGLVEIDRANNLKRKPRKSFYYYANICKSNTVLAENGHTN